jgi:hypothetical protein
MNSQDFRNLQEAYLEVYSVDEASVTDDRVRRNQKAFGSNYTPPRDWDQSANRGKGAVVNAKQKEKQRRKGLAKSAMGEAVDLYDIILSHLLDEGYADTNEAAITIMANMSEDWRESICEGYKRFPYKKVEDKIHKKEDNPTGRGTPQSIQMGKVSRHFRGGKEIPPVEKREHSPQISKAREAENRARRTQEG